MSNPRPRLRRGDAAFPSRCKEGDTAPPPPWWGRAVFLGELASLEKPGERVPLAACATGCRSRGCPPHPSSALKLASSLRGQPSPPRGRAPPVRNRDPRSGSTPGCRGCDRVSSGAEARPRLDLAYQPWPMTRPRSHGTCQVVDAGTARPRRARSAKLRPRPAERYSAATPTTDIAHVVADVAPRRPYCGRIGRAAAIARRRLPLEDLLADQVAGHFACRACRGTTRSSRRTSARSAGERPASTHSRRAGCRGSFADIRQ